MHERASWQRMLITFGVIAVVVVLALWAVVGLSAWIIGPVSDNTPAAVPPKVQAPPPPPVVPATLSVPATTVPATLTVPATPTSSKPADIHAVVAIDPGHQAHGDSSLEPEGPGSSVKKAKVASGAGGESAVNLAVSLKLHDILKAKGITVVMTRTKQNVNVANSKRAQIANAAHADLFVRIHCDGNNNRSLAGLSTLVPQKNRWTGPIVAESKRAGGYVQKAAIAATHAKSRGVVTRSDLSGFNWAKVPSVLVEMGFLSNGKEGPRLKSASYQQKLAQGIADGVVDYLNATGH